MRYLMMAKGLLVLMGTILPLLGGAPFCRIPLVAGDGVMAGWLIGNLTFADREDTARM